MGRRPWGSVTRVSRNKHVIRWVQNTPDGRKRKSRTIHGTYREACLELDRLHVEYAQDAPCPTVSEAAELWWQPWLARRVDEGRLHAATAERYLSCYEKHICARWGETPLAAVKPMDVQSWLLGLTRPNAEVAIAVLRKIGDFAVQYELCDANKFRTTYELPTRISRKKGSDVLSFEQADAVFRALRGSELEPPFILACFGGCRTGESLGLRACEISAVEVRGVSFAVAPIVRRMGSSGDAPFPDGQLKNKQSVRTVLIPGEYGRRLCEIAGAFAADGCEWLANRCDGLPMNVMTLTARWRKSGCCSVPFGNLRASWRTFAEFEWLVDGETLELLMGHALPGVTGRHYLRPSVEQLASRMASAAGIPR